MYTNIKNNNYATAERIMWFHNGLIVFESRERYYTVFYEGKRIVLAHDYYFVSISKAYDMSRGKTFGKIPTTKNIVFCTYFHTVKYGMSKYNISQAKNLNNYRHLAQNIILSTIII